MIKWQSLLLLLYQTQWQTFRRVLGKQSKTTAHEDCFFKQQLPQFYVAVVDPDFFNTNFIPIHTKLHVSFIRQNFSCDWNSRWDLTRNVFQKMSGVIKWKKGWLKLYLVTQKNLIEPTWNIVQLFDFSYQTIESQIQKYDMILL